MRVLILTCRIVRPFFVVSPRCRGSKAQSKGAGATAGLLHPPMPRTYFAIRSFERLVPIWVNTAEIWPDDVTV
jgi:hypothetical protein